MGSAAGFYAISDCFPPLLRKAATPFASRAGGVRRYQNLSAKREACGVIEPFVTPRR